MTKIKRLPDNLISKIAAGEVIERPAYAVKELIENAIDAKASKIVISLKNFGLDEISVFDNGIGIEKSDLKLVSLPHTTSKLNTESDLENIQSMGFRGEALASIASVSNFEIRSRVKNKKGYKLKSKKIIPVAMPEGTEAIIKNIFGKTPARKKFLKTAPTEYRHILSQIQSFTLAYPNIEFVLNNDEKNIYRYLPNNFEDRLIKIFGEEIFKKLLNIHFQDSYLSIEGLISHPQINFKTKNKILIFVNGRRVQNSELVSSIKEGYRNLLMLHTFPLALVNISLPRDLIDVNVHPRKEIIKFINPEDITGKVKEIVFETLSDNNLTFSNLSFKDKLTKSDLARSLRREVMETKEGQIGVVKKSADIIQLLNLYLITETENGILILDQHAVHEAILFYKYKKAFMKKKSQNLSSKIKKPILVALDHSLSNLLIENLDYLNKIGFNISEFGESKFKLSAVPLIATDLDPQENLKETLENLERDIKPDLDENINAMLSYLSCRSAIKSGQKLTKKQMKDLTKYLDKIDLGYTCPHGRPVKVELSKSYLDRLFRRI